MTIDNLFEEGQYRLIDSIKEQLFNYDNSIFERLNFEDDTIYLEPLLFSFFNSDSSKIPLDQILFGYYEERIRPYSVLVKSDSSGNIFLPNYGYFESLQSCSTFNLIKVEDSWGLFKDDVRINCRFHKLKTFQFSKLLEVTNNIDPLSERFFYSWKSVDTNNIHDFLIGDAVSKVADYQSLIEQAFTIIHQCFPEEFKKYAYSTRRIVLFSHPALRNFVNPQMHGTIYLNVSDKSTLGFFLEEIVHQCSHTIFDAVLAETDSFFKVDPSTELGKFIERNDRRTLFSAFHGIYTTGQIVEVLTGIYKSAQLKLSLKERHEILGRLAINKNRINIGLEKAPLNEIFTEKGFVLFNKLNDRLLKNITENDHLFDFEMSTHPVVFDYDKFKDDNPTSLNLVKAQFTDM